MTRWAAGDPLRLPIHVTANLDRWDHEDWGTARYTMPAVEAVAGALAETAPTAEALLADAFWSFYRADPRLLDHDQVRPDHLVNRVVLGEAVTLPAWHTLRQATRGDIIASGMACAEVRPTLEGLLDQYETLRKLAEEIQERLIMLNLLREEIEDAGEDESEEGQRQVAELGDLADKIQGEVDEANDQLGEACEGMAMGVRGSLAIAFDAAGSRLREMADQSRTYGVEPGQWQRMDAEERLALARRLNTPRLERIARLFGPMRELAFTELKRKVDYARTEVVNVSMGGDITAALPSELVRLLDPGRRLDFVRDLVEGKVLQYDLQGDDSVGRGGIVFCEDGSGSMMGTKEEWAKAVMLALLDVARRQKRSFTLIHFGSAYECEMISFASPADYTVDNVLYAAELFFAGGTNFQRPLSEALDLLAGEHLAYGRVRGDIVFCTDGECAVPGKFMDEFKAAQARLGFQVFGITIGGEPDDEPLATICDGRVATVDDLTGGNDIRSVFRAL